MVLFRSVTFTFIQENEMVVQRALQQFQSSFILEHAMPEWTGRGLPMFDGGQHISDCGVRSLHSLIIVCHCATIVRGEMFES